MGRGRDRGRNRRSFDDDQPMADWGQGSQRAFRGSHREDAAPSGPAHSAIVKWYNAGKGFGFVELTDGSGDVFMHAAVLEAAGYETVDPGAKLSVQVGVGQKGRQVTAVLQVDAGAVSDARPVRPSPRPAHGGRPDPSTATTLEGTVKWFRDDKGFGFVLCDDGDKDVFVHAKVVQRAGLSGLHENQRLRMQVVRTPKGREAISITPLDGAASREP